MNVVNDTYNQPVYYPLEAVTEQKSCQDFHKRSEDQVAHVAEDLRYTNVTASDMTSSQLPDEYIIQLTSGVYSELLLQPYYTKYVPNPQTTKQNLQYQFLGRTTLKYLANCEDSIYGAVDVLEEMSGAWGDSVENLNLAVLIMASCYFGILFIWMCLGSCCYICKRDRPVQ